MLPKMQAKQKTAHPQYQLWNDYYNNVGIRYGMFKYMINKFVQ